MANAFGLNSSDETDPLTALIAHLSTAPVKVVFDNCENVLELVGPLSEALVETGGAVWVIATSRSSLRVFGERVVRIEPLGRDDAEQLFAERTKAAQGPGHVFTTYPKEPILARCAGLPLAIELAASALLLMPDGEFSISRIQNRGSAFGQTLSTSIEESLARLEPQDRALFDTVSILPGPFQITDAIHCSGMDVRTATRSCAVLLEHSLLGIDAIDPESSALRMLEPIREVGLQRLDRRASNDSLETAERRYALSLSAELVGASARLLGPGERDLALRLERIDINLALPPSGGATARRMKHRRILSLPRPPN